MLKMHGIDVDKREIKKLEAGMKNMATEMRECQEENERLKKRINYLEIQMSRSGYEQTLEDAERWQKIEPILDRVCRTLTNPSGLVKGELAYLVEEIHEITDAAIDAVKEEGDE